MGLYSNDPGVGASPSVPPSGTPMWSGTPGAPAYSGPFSNGMPASAPPVGAMSPVAMPAQGADPKWPALRTIATVLKVVAWIEGVIGVISALVVGGTLAVLLHGASFIVVIFLLVFAAIGFLLTYASSEIIMLFISIEKNTRAR